MLTLTRPLTIQGFTVYQDEANDLQATPKNVVRFYVLPKESTLAVDEKGNRQISVLIYRSPADGDGWARAGGAITFTVELRITDADRGAVQAGLRALVNAPDAPDADVPLDVVPWTSGYLDVDIGGVSVLDAVPTGGGPRTRQAVVLRLNDPGARRISAMKTLPALGLRQRVAFEHRLAGGSIRVSCDPVGVVELLRHLATADGRVVDADKVIIAAGALIDAGVVTIDVRAPVALDADSEIAAVLTRVARDEIARRTVSLLAAAPGDDDATLQVDVASALNFRCLEGAVMQREETVDSVLDTSGLDWNAIAEYVDLTPPILRVDVRPYIDFAGTPIDSVKVTLVHHGQRDTSAELLFRDATAQRFNCWLDPGDQRSYEWTARYFYKSSAVTYEAHGATADRTLVLESAGLIDVAVALGTVDLAKLPKAEVHLRYASKALGANVEGIFVLGGDQPKSRWNAPVGEDWNGSYDTRVSWLRSDGARLDRPWTKKTERILVLDSPFVGSLEIAVVPAGDFAGPDGIAQVVVDIRYADAPNDYRQEARVIATTNVKQSISFDLLDRDRRNFEYRYLVVRKSGISRAVPSSDGWLQGEPLLVVGEIDDIHLTIDPTALPFDAGHEVA